jgi:hypothetical protein
MEDASIKRTNLTCKEHLASTTRQSDEITSNTLDTPSISLLLVMKLYLNQDLSLTAMTGRGASHIRQTS